MLFVVGVLVSLFASVYVFSIISEVQASSSDYLPNVIIASIAKNQLHAMMFLSIGMVFLLLIILIMNNSSGNNFASEMDEITDTIKTPKMVGQSQHGSAKWLTEKEQDKVFTSNTIAEGYDLKTEKSLKSGGIVVGYKKQKKQKQEKIYYIDDDMHSLILGATRSGKTRCILLQSICFTALANESMLISDPKGEIFDFTAPFLENAGLDVIALDFKNPLKSARYNFLQPIIDAVRIYDIPKAVSLTWDLLSSLVPETKGEPIWQHGESSIIAGSVMSVIFDNMEKPNFQNLTNVYYFINYMCTPNERGELLLNRYIAKLVDTHPSKALFGVSMIAPSKTRGSFFTSALATLRLFTDPNIYTMTCETDFDLTQISEKPTALFVILPDAKKTYYGLASLFVEQLYIALADHADSLGGRLKNRVNFVLEEFGNFTKINLSAMLTVGAGRGMRFNLVVQSFSQIEEKYGKEQTETVKDNCHCLIYIRSDNPNTNAEISKRLGKYTTSSYGRSNSTNNGGGNASASMNLIARDLLMPEEVNKIARPYLIVMLSGNQPAIMQLPDVSKWQFNKMMGMGSKSHNIALRLERQGLREEKLIKKLELWNIWKGLKAEADREKEEKNQKDVPPTKPYEDVDVKDISSMPEHEESDNYGDYEDSEDENSDDEDMKNAVDEIFTDERFGLIGKHEGGEK